MRVSKIYRAIIILNYIQCQKLSTQLLIYKNKCHIIYTWRTIRTIENFIPKTTLAHIYLDIFYFLSFFLLSVLICILYRARAHYLHWYFFDKIIILIIIFKVLINQGFIP